MSFLPQAFSACHMEVGPSMHSVVLSNDLKRYQICLVLGLFVQVLPCALNCKPSQGQEGEPLEVSISAGNREPSGVLVHRARSVSID